MGARSGVPLAVDFGAGKVVTGAAALVGGIPVSDPSFVDNEGSPVFGSRVSSFVIADDGSLDVVEVKEGPGTLLVTVRCHGDVAYLTELSRYGSDAGRLWALKVADDYPEVIAVADLSSTEGFLAEWSDRSVASGAGLFLHVDGNFLWYRMIDGRLEFANSMRASGPVAVVDEHLFMASEDGDLRVFDVSDPGSMPLVASLELPYPHRRWYQYTMVESMNRLWIFTTFKAPIAHPVMVIDVSEPARPRLTAYVELSTGTRGRDFAELAAGDERVWLLTMDSEEDVESPPAMVTSMRLSADESHVEIGPRWIGGPGSEQRFFPTAFAEQDNTVWFISTNFWNHLNSIYSVGQTRDGELRHVGPRDAPAAIRSRSTESFDDVRESFGALSLASCGDRILGTDLEGGLYGINPDRWLEGADAP